VEYVEYAGYVGYVGYVTHLITYYLQHYECFFIARYSNVLYVPHVLHKVLSTLHNPQAQEKQEAKGALITDLGTHMSVDLHLHTKSF